jgi:two-component sensor histidine kinase
MSDLGPTPPGRIYLPAPGKMALLTCAYDWSRSPLGPPECWPDALRHTVRLILASPQPMFIWWGPDLIQFYNDAHAEIMGPERHPSALGDRGRECWAEVWDMIGPPIEAVMRGEGAGGERDRLVAVTRDGVRQEIWWNYTYNPIFDGDAVGGVLVICNDVTREHLANAALAEANARLESETARQRLLGAEMNHRIKNGLTVFQSLVSLTARSAKTVADFKEVLVGRFSAMAKTHDILMESEDETAEVAAVVRAELAPVLAQGDQASFTCERIVLDGRAAASLGLIVHELLTNALKYGALSVADGRLEVDCKAAPGGGVLTWRERVSRPIMVGEPGFGSTLIERLAADLHGTADLVFEPGGLAATITFTSPPTPGV